MTGNIVSTFYAREAGLGDKPALVWNGTLAAAVLRGLSRGQPITAQAQVRRFSHPNGSKVIACFA